jgi:translin
MDNLDPITDDIRTQLDTRNTARDSALTESRALIRHCANAIRAMHRREWEKARTGLQTAHESADVLTGLVTDYPDLYFAGYTQDALKEYVEAFALFALIRDEALPTPDELGVPGSTYLNGLAEAASELRRKCLDVIRGDETEEAEKLLDKMDTIYNVLMGFDFPDAITGGLRRRMDALRGVLERTRGDLTTALTQKRLREAINGFEKRMDLDGS